MKTIALLILGLLIFTTTGGAQDDTPLSQPGRFRSAKRVVPPPIELIRSEEPQFAQTNRRLAPMSLVEAPEIAEAITPEIQALASGLENDPRRIYDFVHDHIRYVHYFGSKKGAQLTLLERSGNDFDQCALLVALLRAAGYPSVEYCFGLVYMPYESPWGDDCDFKHWIGLSMDEDISGADAVTSFAVDLNYERGFPLSQTFNDNSDYIILHHAWVRLTVDNSTFYMDPSYKFSEPIEGLDCATAMGLSTNQLMSVTGGTNNVNYVQYVSEASLRNKLSDYTTNLLWFFQTNCPNASVEEVIGGQRTVSTFGYPLAQSPTNLLFGYLETDYLNFSNIPTNLMSTLTITVDSTMSQSLLMPQLQGERLSLTFSTNGLAQLWLEDDLLAQKQTSGASTVNVEISVDHPYGSWDTTNNNLINSKWVDQTVQEDYQRTNASYAISYAFDPDKEWLRKRQTRLDAYRDQGLSDNSREVTTETLNIMGLSYMVQTYRSDTIIATENELIAHHYHCIGRMGQEYGRGYYIDIYADMCGEYPTDGNGTNELARSNKYFELCGLFNSGAEYAIIEQLQSSNLVAASSVKMLQIANTNGQKTFVAKSSNWSTVQSSLVNYDKNFLKSRYIDNGYTLLLPENGSNAVSEVGTWRGYGLIAIGTITNNDFSYTEARMEISGGYHGGYVDEWFSVVEPWYLDAWGYSQEDYFNEQSDFGLPNYDGDPVNMADGSFLVNETDLSLGQSEPRGIRFARYYNSNRRRHNLASMANGWVHNYYSKAVDISSPFTALGETTPAQMAAMIVATKSAFALYNSSRDPKTWLVTSLIAKWGLDQLIKNAVSVSLGDATVEFIKQPNGTYTPPAQSKMTLVKTNGNYWLQERHGNILKYSADGMLNSIVDQYNKSLSVSYDNSNRVHVITDWVNRTLTLNYSATSQRLESIVDSTGRTVSYGYTNISGQLDLGTVSDAENKTSSYVYDTNHQIIATKDALTRVVVSNVYDGFGRVVEQYNKGDTNQASQLYWSGFQNIIVDPAGGRQQYYYDDKHRLTTSIDPLWHYTDTYYDGQDHVIQTVSQMYATNRFIYDGRQNLVMSIDPLGYTNQFIYDNQDNLWQSIDPRGGHCYYGYNSKYQMTGSTNGAGDWITWAYNSSDGNLTNRTDIGGTTGYGYDNWGQLNSIVYPGSLGRESFVNNARGDMLTHTNALNFATSFEYNNRRQLTNTTSPTNVTVSVVYDSVGNVQSTKDPIGNVRSNIWSATQKLLSTVLPETPQGIPITTNIYDTRDWLSSSSNALLKGTFYTNDAAGRLISVTDPLTRTTKYTYDDDNRKITTANATNEITRQLWSVRGDLIKVTDPESNLVQRVYDGVGNQTLLTNRNNKRWQFFYDGANRLTNTVSPMGNVTAQVWDKRGLLQTIIQPSTNTANLLYDARGRLTNRTDNVGVIKYRYDANNNLTNVIEGVISNSWVFDAYNRAYSYTDSAGNVINYRYDANGNLTDLIYPGGKTVHYLYDNLNRMTNVTDWANRKTTITYDLANRIKSIKRPNRTVRELNYDDAGQITNILERTSIGDPIALFKYKWNSAARMDWEFAAPLTHAVTRPTRQMTYNDDNQISTYSGGNVIYDRDGNLKTGPLTNDTFVSYVYDARNRLMSAGGLGYGYDAAGNRVSTTLGTNTTSFVLNPIASLSQVLIRIKPDNSKTYYVYGPGLLYEVTENSAGGETGTSTYHYDYRGSTIAISDVMARITDRMEYSAYGLITYRSCGRSGQTDTPFLYNGRYGVQTDSNGLLFMRSRYYNPYICRFLNPDPSGFAGGINFYTYADGNPISMTDPFGLCAEGSSGMEYNLACAGMGSINFFGGLLGAPNVVNNLQMVSSLYDKYGASGYYEQNGALNTSIMLGGEITGTTPVAEGIYGVDIGRGYELDNYESAARIISGSIQMAVTALTAFEGSLRFGSGVAAEGAISSNAARFEIQTQGGMLTRDGRVLENGTIRSRTDFVDQTTVRRVDFDHAHGDIGAPHVVDMHANPNNPLQINAGKPRVPEPGEYLSPVLSDPRIQGGVFRP